MTRVYDNWERLVAATLKRQQFRQLCLADSPDSSFSSTGSFDFSSNSSPLHDSFLNLGSHGAGASQILSEPSSSSAAASSRFKADILSSHPPNAKPIPLYELKKATKNFQPNRILGDGEYGPVYEGWICEPSFPVSMAVAIKKLNPVNFEVHSNSEWIREVELLGQICHSNLVKLIGYYIDSENKLLVHEFMQKGRLDRHLFSRDIPPLSWDTRPEIAIGAARGLYFLHEAKQPDFNAKLSGFGLAKFRMPIPRRPMRIPGRIYVDELDLPDKHMTRDHEYAAPEHVATGEVSTKSDVYSFGLVLLELFSGCRAFDLMQISPEQRIVEWGKPYLRDSIRFPRVWDPRSEGSMRRLRQLMDPRLEGQYPPEEAQKIAAIASLCLAYNPNSRPSMGLIVTALEKRRAPKKFPDRKS